MGTLGRVREGNYIVNDVDGVPYIENTDEELITSRDKKVRVILEPPYSFKDYFIAGPDVGDNYFISDACGIAIQLKKEDTLPFWNKNVCGSCLSLNFGNTTITGTTSAYWYTDTGCAHCGKKVDAMYCYKCMVGGPK